MKYLIVPFIFIASLFMAGCDKGDAEPERDYYVRYTAIAEPNRMVNMYFSNETGNNTGIHTAMPDGKFQYSVGPVMKGFKAELVVSYEDVGAVDFLSIEVARGAEPFVLKKSGSDYFSLYDVVE